MADQPRPRKMLPVPKDWDDLFPNRFLRAESLGDRKVTVTIRAVERELLPDNDGKDEARTIVSFVESKKHFTINRTNGELIAAIMGKKPQEWVGKQITIYQTETKAFGETKPCVRIWGSPELTADLQVKVVLTKRSPNQSLRKETLHFTLYKTERRIPRGQRTEGGQHADASGGTGGHPSPATSAGDGGAQ